MCCIILAGGPKFDIWHGPVWDFISSDSSLTGKVVLPNDLVFRVQSYYDRCYSKLVYLPKNVLVFVAAPIIVMLTTKNTHSKDFLVSNNYY